METFALALLIIFGVYCSTSVLLLAGTRQPAAPASPASTPRPRVSVLIAARNEATRLPGCLDSLLQSSYPSDCFEVIVIDDRSTDATLAIAQDYARRHRNLKAVAIHRRLDGMSGKASTICQGLTHATGEIMLVTDADCLVPRYWLESMVSHFTAEVGLVGGFTLLSPFAAIANFLTPSYADSLMAKVQTLDWMYLLTVGAGAAGMGWPVSILGNNFGFRRAAYEQIGGYEAVGFSIVEDFALMRKILQETSWQVRFPLAADTRVFSFPPATLRNFLDQRRRWAAGGKEFGWFAKYLMILAFLRHLALISAGLLSWPLLALGGAAVLLCDFVILLRAAVSLKRCDLLRYFGLFELYYLLYSFAFAPTLLLPATVHWKGVKYRWGMSGKIKSVQE